jgi:hypothetical protein
MMLKHVRISHPNGGLDPHVAQGHWGVMWNHVPILKSWAAIVPALSHMD